MKSILSRWRFFVLGGPLKWFDPLLASIHQVSGGDGREVRRKGPGIDANAIETNEKKGKCEQMSERDETSSFWSASRVISSHKHELVLCVDGPNEMHRDFSGAFFCLVILCAFVVFIDWPPSQWLKKRLPRIRVSEQHLSGCNRLLRPPDGVSIFFYPWRRFPLMKLSVRRILTVDESNCKGCKLHFHRLCILFWYPSLFLRAREAGCMCKCCTLRFFLICFCFKRLEGKNTRRKHAKKWKHWKKSQQGKPEWSR